MSRVASRVPTLRILLTNTKVPRSTKILVAGVKEKILKVQHPCGCRDGDVCWGGEIPHELRSHAGLVGISWEIPPVVTAFLPAGS